MTARDPGGGARRLRSLRCAVAAVLLVVLAACGGGDGNDTAVPTTSPPAAAQDGAGDGGDAGEGGENDEAGGGFGQIPDLVEEVEPSVVAVRAGQSQGSGVVWADDIVLTNRHVVAEAQEIELIFADGRRAPAEVVATDAILDLALLRSERGGLPPAEFAEELPRVGELVIAIGNPLGFQHSVTAGIVSGLHRSIPAQGQRSLSLVNLIQSDAPISPGNSGGALVDAEGRVVGINIAFIPPQAQAVAIGFAIPAPSVTDAAQQLLEEGEVSHAFVGIRPASLTPQVAERFELEVEQGVVALEVTEGGPAAEAGVEAGDVVVAVDGTSVADVGAFLTELRQREPGDRVTLTVVRDGDEREVEVELGERPEG